MASPQSPAPPLRPEPRTARRLRSTENGSLLLALPLERFSSSGTSAHSTLKDGDVVHHRRGDNRRLREYRPSLSHTKQQQQQQVRLRESDGTHFVYAHVGNPSHTVSLIVDTGSDTTAFPCAECNDCRMKQRRAGEDDIAFWDPQQSYTASMMGCGQCQEPYQ